MYAGADAGAKLTGDLQESVAVLVPFRNERDHLPRLLASLLAQTFPRERTELLFLDDHSTDGGAEWLAAAIAGHPHCRLLRLAAALDGRTVVAHKKAALTLGVSRTTAGLIVTTDADCCWPPERLSELVAAAAGKRVVLAPVAVRPNDTDVCTAFQALDLYAYQFLTAVSVGQGSPVLANGACFTFRRSAFLAVDGYAGVDHLPSGDDVLLLHKFLEHYAPTDFGWLRTADPVTTLPVRGWRALWRQRLRWAGKAGAYRNPRLDIAQGLTFGANFALLAVVLLYPLHLRAVAPLVILGVKMLVDLLGLYAVTRQFRATALLRWYPAVAVVYPVFLVGVGVAVLVGVRPTWKGRSAS